MTVQYKLPVKVVVLNNGFLGMVKQWQKLFYEKRYTWTCLPSPDCVKVAKVCGTEGYRITEEQDINAVLKKAFKSNHPAFIDDSCRPLRVRLPNDSCRSLTQR